MLIRYEKKHKEMESKKDFCDSRSRSNGSRVCRMQAGTKKDADKTTEINVGYFNNVTHAQALYMKAQGTLDKSI